MMILKGKEAEEILRYLMQHFEGEGRYTSYPVAGYFIEEGLYTCFDNTAYCCFVEQAKNEEAAKMWCLKEIEATDLYKAD